MAKDILTTEQILDAGEETLRLYGPQKTTVVDVARVLKVSHGSVYRHFASKADLRAAVVMRWLKRISLPLVSIAWRQSNAAERMQKWLETLINVMHEAAEKDPQMFAAYAGIMAEGDDLNSFHDSHIEQLIIMIEEGVQAGQFSAKGQPKSAALAIYQATSPFHHPAFAANWQKADTMEEFMHLFQLVLQGLEAR